VVTYREEWLYLRVLLAQKLSIPHHPSLEAIVNSQDKHLMRQLLKREGLQENFYFEKLTLDELSDPTKYFKFPIFVKPVKGIRSEWSRWIKNRQALEDYVTCLKNKVNTIESHVSFLVEEVLEGHEVDVDLVLFEGKLLYGKVSDNFPTYRPYALETGHLMPSILSENYQQSLVALAYRSALACGYDRGVLHVEAMLRASDSQLVIIEINGRLGGMYIAKWHEIVWGVDLIGAELAISAGISPISFCQEKNERVEALAQICVTTNSDGDEIEENKHEKKEVDECFIVQDWMNIEDFKRCTDVFSAVKWIQFPYEKKEIAVNGHVNVGEVTVKDVSPVMAFKKLIALFTANPMKILTNKGRKILF
jgi:biotin carboxylase